VQRKDWQAEPGALQDALKFLGADRGTQKTHLSPRNSRKVLAERISEFHDSPSLQFAIRNSKSEIAVPPLPRPEGSSWDFAPPRSPKTLRKYAASRLTPEKVSGHLNEYS